MKINLSISKRINAQGYCEVMLLIRRKSEGKVIDVRAKSGVFIYPNMFDAKKGEVKAFAANKLMTEEVKYHNTQLKKLKELLCRISEAYNDEQDKNNVYGMWLENIVHPASMKKESTTVINDDDTNVKKDIYHLFNKFLEKKQCSEFYRKGMMVCIRSVARFELYMRKTDTQYRNFTFDVDTVTKADIEKYKIYISNEKELAEDNPKLFMKILSNYPTTIKRGKLAIEDRGSNSVYKLMKKLKSFFIWLNCEGITDNQPFMGVELGSEKYGTPYYITSKERDTIASTTMPSKHLETQRDIFIFQCYIGCRVGDLMRLTSSNITGNMLIYTPHKTKEEGQQALQARVPLHKNAAELIKKYKGIDKQGRLFPFISQQNYNYAIKKVFAIAGITRMVEVRNALTGEMESRPINEVASSHLARKTFVGNLYSKVTDPNLIGKMSGHVEGSKAFARYRKIEDETLKSVIELL